MDKTAKTVEELRQERDALVTIEYGLYDPDHFPGSKEWQRHNAAEIALREFDSQHPEVAADLTDD